MPNAGHLGPPGAVTENHQSSSLSMLEQALDPPHATLKTLPQEVSP